MHEPKSLLPSKESRRRRNTLQPFDLDSIADASLSRVFVMTMVHQEQFASIMQEDCSADMATGAQQTAGHAGGVRGLTFAGAGSGIPGVLGVMPGPPAKATQNLPEACLP